MMRIAICDDQKWAVSQQETIVRNSLQLLGMDFEIVTYTRSINLICDIIEDGFFYDLILLDIEMPEVSGMEIPEKIKTFLPKVRIIFVTSHTEYALDAFELSIFRYIPKNHLKEKLTAAVLDAARLVALESGQEYVIQTANRMEKIPYRDIFYIQREGKNARITSGFGVSHVRKSLQKVYEELASPEFIFIERGYIVNILHIMKMCEGRVFLKNGESLPVSRSHLQGVKQQISRFWGAHI